MKRQVATLAIAFSILGAVAPLLDGAVIPVLTATPALGGCITETFYAVTGTNQRVPFRNVPVFKNGPGGTVSASRSYSGTASYAVVAGAETEVGAVLAKAKVSISAALTQTNSTTTTVTYSRNITSRKYGRLQYVSWGKRVAWRKSRVTANCKSTLISSGTIDFPANQEGWYYWETST